MAREMSLLDWKTDECVVGIYGAVNDIVERYFELESEGYSEEDIKIKLEEESAARRESWLINFCEKHNLDPEEIRESIFPTK